MCGNETDKIEKITSNLKKLSKDFMNKKKYEKALVCISTYSDILYNYNQKYLDNDIERMLIQLSKKVLKASANDKINKDIILFYDGFGLDLRGWAISYVRALTKLGYYVVYVTTLKSKGKIPHILSELNSSKSDIVYLDSKKSLINIAIEIDSIFKKYKPECAFFYTTPYDVSAAMAFSNNSKTTKFQIDLTDHAFWIGINAFDYILESREMGASIAHYNRKIPLEKIIKFDSSPYINSDKCKIPLPFDINKEKYIFTGGALYKTLGDKNLFYYKIINHILDNYEDIKFLYAGSGDTSEIHKLMKKFPNRVFLIKERPDFFLLIQKCILYINSFPMFGGLMMRYAALAKKIPITLKHSNDSDGILINQEELGIEFVKYEDCISEIDLLLTNDLYRKAKESMIQHSVLNEDNFIKNLNLLIKQHKSFLNFNIIKKFDTTEFRNEYKNRFKSKDLYKSFAKKSNIVIFRNFPMEIICGILIKIKEKINND